jgi:hypothetical protein
MEFSFVKNYETNMTTTEIDNDELLELLTLTMTKDEYGTIMYRDADGKLHRDRDLPAVIYLNGTQEWHRHGKRHRDGDLPAYVGANGTLAWWKNGLRHRDGDLPAYIWADKTQEWWENGERIYKESASYDH